jgi:hypothetical protein
MASSQARLRILLPHRQQPDLLISSDIIAISEFSGGISFSDSGAKPTMLSFVGKRPCGAWQEAVSQFGWGRFSVPA